MRLTSGELYDRLIRDDKILELNGKIKFYFGDVNIVVKQKDVVGNIIQEWLGEYLKKHKIAHKISDNTQMPPDFFLNPDDLSKDLLGVWKVEFLKSYKKYYNESLNIPRWSEVVSKYKKEQK